MSTKSSQLLFTNAVPERFMLRMGEFNPDKPLRVKSGKELPATIKPHRRKHPRADNGNLPDNWSPSSRGCQELQNSYGETAKALLGWGCTNWAWGAV